MWIKQMILVVLGLSAGVAAAGGLFSFIVGLGVVSEFADRTHTGDCVLLYEESIALGGIFGNLFYLFPVTIFIRRVKLLRAIPYIIAGIAFGKGIGSLIYFWKGWG